MGGCFSKSGRISSNPISATVVLPTGSKIEFPQQSGETVELELSAGKPELGEDARKMSADHTAFEPQRRRLSVSHSEACDADDNDVERGTTLFLTKENTNSDLVRSLLTPKVAGSSKPPSFSDHPDLQPAESKDEDESSESPRDDSPTQELRVEEPPNQQRRRLSISGCLPSTVEENFSNKRLEMKGGSGSPNLQRMGIGYACKKGLKPESPNQDDFFIVRIDDWGLYGVFDGHGPFGHDVSNFVQRELPKLIYDNVNFWSDPSTALKESFNKVHNDLVETCRSESFDCSLSGTTASVVLHKPLENKLYVAHVGDSRCVLGRLRKDGGGMEAVDLTIDHKPNNEGEKRRIVQSGGQVKRLEGDIPHRVFLRGKLYPGLAMSRAIGDLIGGQAGVISSPDVSEVTLNPETDDVLIICSDGVWEFVASQEAVDIVNSCGRERVQNAADILARESWERWIHEEGNVVDDITSQVIHLREKWN